MSRGPATSSNHLGASSDREFDGNKVHLSLTANPSHLEIVNPVVMGKARAKQDQIAKVFEGDIIPLRERAKVMPLLLHGDAAFAGQGVVAEILGLSGLRGHRVCRHDACDHQQPDRLYHQSGLLALLALPLRCRQDDRGADLPRQRRRSGSRGLYAAKVATEFRMKFHKPVVIDMFCYRRYGHNEGDEPSFTQPKMYKVIRAHKPVTQIYAERLIAEGLITEGEFEKMKADWRARWNRNSRPDSPTSPTRPTGWTAPGRGFAPPTMPTSSAAARPPCR